MKLKIPILTLALAAIGGGALYHASTPLAEAKFVRDVRPLGMRLTPEDDRCEPPRLELKTPEVDPSSLALLSTSAEVDIAGVIANVRVTQVYANEGDAAVEARYVFPASTRAAVHGMRMKIGDQVIEAQVKRKAKAQAIYQKAKRRGKTASLLTQHRPNVFEMDVANIPAGGRVEIELDYTEHLTPSDKIYEFVYPTAVVERYSKGGQAETWEGNPFIKDDNDSANGHGSASPQRFDISVKLDAGLPVDELRCISHDVETKFIDKRRAELRLGGEDDFAANRDFILQYRLAGEKVASGLLLHKDPENGENFFILNVQPPKRPRMEEVPPREYVFVVDVSGSMNGFPLDTSKALLRELLPRLRPQDRFNLLLFAGGFGALADRSMPATAENVQKAVRMIEGQRGGGGTEMLPPMQTAFDMRSDKGTSRSIVLVTDGLVRYEKATFELIRQKLGEANVFAFGIGANINRLLVEGVAHTGCGEPIIVTRPDEASAAADRFWKYIATPVLTDIEIDYGGLDVYDVEPPSIPDVIAERPVVVFGKWRAEEDAEEVKAVTLSGRTGKREVEMELPVGEELEKAGERQALPYLWARKRIATLGDYRQRGAGGEVIEEITQLGLQYNLLTDYTAFVAVAHDPQPAPGATRKVKTTPEPGTGALLIFGLSSLLLRRRR